MHQGLNVSTLQRCGNEKTRRPRRKENPITIADDWIRYAGMNKIFEQVDRYMHESLRKGLPDIKPCDLEKDGAVFYMNGKKGTAFDWYVNEHFPYFFIFYNDKENLGAVKAALYTDGGLTVYVYGEKGHAEPLHFEEQVQATSEELLDLAVLLTAHADDNRPGLIRQVRAGRAGKRDFHREELSLFSVMPAASCSIGKLVSSSSILTAAFRCTCLFL